MPLKHGNSIIARLAFCLAIWGVLMAPGAKAQIVPTSPTTSWTAITYGNNNFPDPSSDQQTGGKEADLVGNSAHPAFYKQFYDGGTPANLADGQLAFRLRLAEHSTPQGYTGAAFVGLDGDRDGSLDVFLGVNNQGSGNVIGIWDAATGLNISPSTTSISSPPRFTYAETSANYNWSAVSLTLDPTAATLDVDAGGSTDFFLTWLVPVADVATAFAANGVAGFNQDSVFTLVAATATQDNSLNQDLSGVSGSVNSSLGWAQLGAASLPYSSSGTTPVPEPSSVLLILLGAGLVLAFRFGRR